MPALPDPARAYPITLPDGSAHPGTVFLSRVIDHPRFRVGDYTYASDFDPPPKDGWAARLAPYLFDFSQEELRIGRFCQIAHGVRFIGSSANHAIDGISTFPFAVFDPQTMLGYQPDCRDMEIGHDVWLGYGAMVCPGARIGNGAIIGAGSVVRGAVPAYAVACGNPAQVVRMRFSPEQIARLERLCWWDWPRERLETAVEALQKADIDTLERLAP